MAISNEVLKTNFDPVKDAESQSGVAGSILGKYYTRIMIGNYSRPKPFESSKFTETAAIFLPIPTELRDDTSVSYTNPSLETVGDIINGAGVGATAGAALLKKSGDIIETVGGFAGKAINAAGKVAGIGGLTEAITTGVGSLFPAELMTSAIQQTTGLAPNPNPSVAFQGPVLREFSYSWALYPKSREETEKIEKLIKVLKAAALPSNYINNSAAILSYPKMCQVNFFPWDKGGKGPWYWSDGSIIRFKKCVMQSVNVNYNPFGTPAFFEGSEKPVSYMLTISFREIEYMLSHDWDDTLSVPGGDEGAVVGQVATAVNNTKNDATKGSTDTISVLGKAVL